MRNFWTLFFNAFFIRLFWIITITSCFLIEGRSKRSSSRDSLSNAFDAAIAQLDQKEIPPVSYMRENFSHGKSDGINTYIQDLIDTLDGYSVRNKKPYVATYDQWNTHSNKEFNDNMSQATSIKNRINIDQINEDRAEKTGSILGNQDIDTILHRFKQNRDFGQLALQQVLDLLDLEQSVVRHLVAGRTGAHLQDALEKRNALLHRTIPLAVNMYDAILTAATQNNTYNVMLSKRTGQGKKLLKALTTYDQKMFMLKLEKNIENYQHIIKKLQQDLNVNAETIKAA